MPKKVLLIEYEPRYIERIRALLAPLGLTLTEAHDGEAGLQAFGSSKFDVVLLSGMLPRLPSAEVIREIRKKGGATAPPILLMMSGYRGTNRKADAQKVGAFDILARPFNDEDLVGSVRDAIESSDIGAKTMRIDTSQLAAASPLTSNDIFSDVLSDLTGEAPAAPAKTPSPSGPIPIPFPSASPDAAPPVSAKPAAPESDIDKRLRDTLSGLNLGSRPGVAPKPAAPTPIPIPVPPVPAPAPKKLSSDTDVDRIISDTLSGVLPKSRPAAPAGATPPPPSGGTAARRAEESGTRRRAEPEAAVPATGPDRFGQYEIIEKIASGGMAELYKAKRTGVEGFQKIVAIKKILPHLAEDDEFITMFADEAKLAAQLNHPNIIHIYDLGKIQAGGYFIAMEHVDGRDLRSIEKSADENSVPLPVPLAVYVASKVASALDYAHRRRDADGRELNIVHRDVSPQNILISYEGDIKLCDFGIAKAASKASKTQSGALKGKIQYMSPEQAWGKPIDKRSDLFSLGVVLHELLTGERLFRGDTDISVLEKVRSAEVIPPSRMNPEVPQNLDAVVLRALAKDPDERYANASDMLRDLESVLYSYTPAPGSADVAIYLHRLQSEESAVAESKAREAASRAEESAETAEPSRKRKSKSVPIARRPAPAQRSEPARESGEAAAGAAPAPRREAPPPSRDVFGTLEAKSVEAERKSRMPLYAAIGVAAAALIGFTVWKMSRPAPSAAPAAAQATPAAAPAPAEPTAAAASVVATPAPAPPAAALDPKAIEAEVQRQVAAKRKELEKAAAAKAAQQAAAAEPTAEPSPVPTEPEPTEAPTAVPTARPEPTALPTEVPMLAPAAAEVRRGDLVGPGTGVVEPVLVSPPRVVYPPIAKQQRVEGKVVVLVLVDENGNVTETRLQQGVAQSAINNAVLAGVKSAKFKPATKNGLAVKMWRPVIVDVKP
jgi:TonB family protein